LKRQSDYLQFRPYRAIAAPPLKRTRFSAADGKSSLLGFAVGSARELPARHRLLYAVLAVAVIGIGLLWRSSFVSLPLFLTKYGGSAWWSLLVFLGCGFVWPRAKTWVVAVLALAFSFGIEFSQLYHAPWIDFLRSIELGSLILGNTFNGPDLPAYASGILLGAVLESILGRRNAGGDLRLA